MRHWSNSEKLGQNKDIMVWVCQNIARLGGTQIATVELVKNWSFLNKILFARFSRTSASSSGVCGKLQFLVKQIHADFCFDQLESTVFVFDSMETNDLYLRFKAATIE